MDGWMDGHMTTDDWRFIWRLLLWNVGFALWSGNIPRTGRQHRDVVSKHDAHGGFFLTIALHRERLVPTKWLSIWIIKKGHMPYFSQRSLSRQYPFEHLGFEAASTFPFLNLRSYLSWAPDIKHHETGKQSWSPDYKQGQSREIQWEATEAPGAEIQKLLKTFPLGLLLTSWLLKQTAVGGLTAVIKI